MGNVYRAPEVPQSKPQKAPVPHKVREGQLTLERAAANANLRLISGSNLIPNKQDEKKPFRQPFWFVHKWGEVTGVYVEAEGVRRRNENGILLMSFKVAEAKERLRQFLVNYYASGAAMGLSIIEFGGIRGFRLKTAHPQPEDSRRR
jgi:hypothetical protein